MTCFKDKENLLLDIENLMRGDYSDVTLVVEGEEIPVHKCILATRCEYFR